MLPALLRRQRHLHRGRRPLRRAGVRAPLPFRLSADHAGDVRGRRERAAADARAGARCRSGDLAGHVPPGSGRRRRAGRLAAAAGGDAPAGGRLRPEHRGAALHAGPGRVRATRRRRRGDRRRRPDRAVAARRPAARHGDRGGRHQARGAGPLRPDLGRAGAGAGLLRSHVAEPGRVVRSRGRVAVLPGVGASPGRPARATARSPAFSQRCCAAKDRCRRRPARRRSARRASKRPTRPAASRHGPSSPLGSAPGGPVIRSGSVSTTAGSSPMLSAPSRSVDPTRNRHEIARRQARRHPRRTRQRARLHPRRRQGRRHGRRPRGNRRRSGHRPAAIAGRLPRPDARDRPPGAGRHHAHEREHQRRPDDPGAAVRRVAGHAGRPRQRHDRHPRGRRRGIHAGALAARSARRRSSRS